MEPRIEIARLLNRGGVSAAPLGRLAAISIFDDEEYENYDFDLVPPSQRLRIAAILTAAGFRQRSGRTFVDPDGGDPVVFPKPGILGSDPSRPAADLLSAGRTTVLVTPTQAILLYLHHDPELAPPLADELTRLVWEQPANLDKIQEWARAAGRDRAFRRLRGALEDAQAEGVDLRKRRLFRSRLPA